MQQKSVLTTLLFGFPSSLIFPSAQSGVLEFYLFIVELGMAHTRNILISSC